MGILLICVRLLVVIRRLFGGVLLPGVVGLLIAGLLAVPVNLVLLVADRRASRSRLVSLRRLIGRRRLIGLRRRRVARRRRLVLLDLGRGVAGALLHLGGVLLVGVGVLHQFQLRQFQRRQFQCLGIRILLGDCRLGRRRSGPPGQSGHVVLRGERRRSRRGEGRRSAEVTDERLDAVGRCDGELYAHRGPVRKGIER